MATPPIILQMEMHCHGCAKKIRKAIQNHPGVVSVMVQEDRGLVLVGGSANASALKSRLESKLNRPVTVVSDGKPPPKPKSEEAQPEPEPEALHISSTSSYMQGEDWQGHNDLEHCMSDENPNACCSIQ